MVSFATLSTAWRRYADAYSDLPHDPFAVAGTQCTVALSIVMDVLLALLTVVGTIRVLNGRSGRQIVTVVGALGLLRLSCANLLVYAFAQPGIPGDQVAADLKHAVPSWAQHTMFPSRSRSV